MKVILLQDVKSLGKEGEIVNVNDGYARNFIIPKKLGVEANSRNMNDLKLKYAAGTIPDIFRIHLPCIPGTH